MFLFSYPGTVASCVGGLLARKEELGLMQPIAGAAIVRILRESVLAGDTSLEAAQKTGAIIAGTPASA